VRSVPVGILRVQPGLRADLAWILPANSTIMGIRLYYKIYELAGLPALQRSEPGQVRKEAATATYASAGGKARLLIGVSAR
jgi:hypothetical protein